MSRRPCACDRGDCPRCRLYHTSDIHNRLWGGPGVAVPPEGVSPPARTAGMSTPPAATAPPPCEHRGERLTVAAARGFELPDWWRTYFPCGHPDRPNPSLRVRGDAAYVCPCQGCGPSCRGYTPGEGPD